MRIQSKLTAGVTTASLVIIASIASIPARADTIGITYSFFWRRRGGTSGRDRYDSVPERHRPRRFYRHR